MGVLGEPDAALLDTVTAQRVPRLLTARTAVSTSEASVAAWAERAVRSGWEDAWLIGARMPGGAWAGATLEIRDVLDPERSVLAVTARAPRSPPREVELVPPSPRASVRLLRDPFDVAAPAPRPQQKAHGPASNLVFGVTGAKLFTRNMLGEIVAYPVPNSPRDNVGRPKRYRPRGGGVVAAVGWVKGAVAMLTLTPQEIILEQTTDDGPALLRRRVRREGLVVPDRDDPLSPLIYRDVRGPRCSSSTRPGRSTALPTIAWPPISICWTRCASSAWRRRCRRWPWHPRASRSSGATRRRARAARGTRRSSGAQTLQPGAPPALDAHWYLVELRTDTKPSSKELILGDGSFQACLGSGVAAVQRRGETWTIFDGGAPAEMMLPAGTRLVGLRPGNAASDLKLVLLEADERTISLSGRTSSHALPRASGRIANVAVNPWRAQLAYATTAGEVVIHSLYNDKLLARFAPEW